MDTEFYSQLEKSLLSIVTENIKNNVFSACSIGIVREGTSSLNNVVFNYGESGGNMVSQTVDNRTFYDLASLTKPLVTSLCILSLVEKGQLKLTDSLDRFFYFSDDRHRGIKVIHLLEHTSGFPAHREYFKELITLPQKDRNNVLISRITDEKLISDPGKKELYSDLGYILLGNIVEKITETELDTYWQKTILQPLGLEKGLIFTRNQNLKEKLFTATGICQWSNNELSGLVNDDNCRSLGGVAGHAGMFGTAEALLKLVTSLLEMYKGSYTHPNLSMEKLKKLLKVKKERWVLGFDTPSKPISSSGNYFSHETIGHLGFTGTSFWLDCKKMIGVVLLTNRVLCGDDLTGIRKFRPQIHDIIMKELTDRKENMSAC